MAAAFENNIILSFTLVDISSSRNEHRATGFDDDDDVVVTFVAAGLIPFMGGCDWCKLKFVVEPTAPDPMPFFILILKYFN